MTGSEIRPGERVKNVHFDDDTFSVDLVDGRTITVPYAWYPRLLHATSEQRSKWETCGGGYGGRGVALRSQAKTRSSRCEAGYPHHSATDW